MKRVGAKMAKVRNGNSTSGVKRASLPRPPLLLLVGVLLFAALTWAAPRGLEDNNAGGHNQAASATAEGGAHFKLPPLFDFQNFKRLFEKSYSGLLEELTRSKYFLSRAFRAFVSAVKYQHRQASFYLAVNSMSDRSPQELERMRNKRLAEFSRTFQRDAVRVVEPPAAAASSMPEFMPSDETDVAEELAKLVASHPDEPAFKELGAEMRGGAAEERMRRKRAASEGQRELNLNRLINTGAGVELAPGARAKVRARVPSDNPNYEPLELASFGLVDQQEAVNVWEIRARPGAAETYDLAGRVSQALSGGGGEGARKQEADGPANSMELDERPDEVFLDLRDTNCFFLPRQQGSCGSCYAFAAVAIMEWIYCARHGALVAFSEQYFVDCGKQHVDQLNGCEGGSPYGCAHFVHNFGLELRLNYPYRLQEDQCPYDQTTDLKTTGYLRAELGAMSAIPVALWPAHLALGPLLVCISIADGFDEYGGGVHGRGCNQTEGEHAVVVIGHGREEGREYWLMRNSHSVGWGEGGYYKLDKAANCVQPVFGFKFGSSDGAKYTFSPDRNERNDPEQVKRHYALHNMAAEPELEQALAV